MITITCTQHHPHVHCNPTRYHVSHTPIYIPSNPASLRNDEFLRALPIAKKERFETLPEILGNVLYLVSNSYVTFLSARRHGKNWIHLQLFTQSQIDVNQKLIYAINLTLMNMSANVRPKHLFVTKSGISRKLIRSSLRGVDLHSRGAWHHFSQRAHK
jgi:hypothetical protein